jgi:hypothetical protein
MAKALWKSSDAARWQAALDGIANAHISSGKKTKSVGGVRLFVSIWMQL